jgi:hypothetical protein
MGKKRTKSRRRAKSKPSRVYGWGKPKGLGLTSPAEILAGILIRG